MISNGFKRSQYDSCVDDMLIAAKSKKEIATLKEQLSSEFEMKDLGATRKILGMEIGRDKIWFIVPWLA
jgi:hypothetical protein